MPFVSSIYSSFSIKSVGQINTQYVFTSISLRFLLLHRMIIKVSKKWGDGKIVGSEKNYTPFTIQCTSDVATGLRHGG